jgi:topoisomerase-4 subunit A
MKESDYILLESPMNTQHYLLMFTSAGNYIYQPVHELPDIRWRDLGQHVSSIIQLEQNETIVAAIGIDSFNEDAVIVTASENGLIKQSKLTDYQVQRYSRTFKTMGIKKGDKMIDARLIKGDEDIILFTNQAYALRFSLPEIAVTGIRTAGVKGINLKDDDKLVSFEIVREAGESILVATQRGAVKRMMLKEFESASRAQRGVVVLKELKSNPHRVVGTEMVTNDEVVILATEKEHKIALVAGSLRPVDRQSNGSFIADETKDGNVTHIYKDPKAEVE